MRTFPVLALSTAHLTAEAERWLEENEHTIPCYSKKFEYAIYGWFVFAEDHDLNSYPKCIGDCIKFALQNGCDCIMFDCDEEPIAELPIYQ